jgi:hypothetical protein
MPSSRYFYSASRRARRFLTVVSLVAYLTSVWGFPLPQAASHDHSVPFPCQDHHCGCVSAEQCWASCCCFTPAQRLAWAERHDVTIPENVELALRTEEQTEHDHDNCATGEVADDHEHHSEHKNRACCGGHDHEPADAQRACAICTPPESGTNVHWVSAFEARKCRGLSTLWIVTGAAVAPAIESLWEFDWAPAGQTSSAVRSLQSVTSLPTVPPPRV